MNYNVLWGLLLSLYGLFVFYLTVAKPPKLWGIKKIQAFVNTLGEKGTDIFFYVWGAIAVGFGIWFFMR